MTERARAVGDELIAVHTRLREQLSTVRAQLRRGLAAHRIVLNGTPTSWD
ncbi:hypothetical protein ACFV0L_41650 [Streptosporangium canum]